MRPLPALAADPPAWTSPAVELDEPLLDADDQIDDEVELPRIPIPGIERNVRLEAALDTGFVVGSEYSNTTVNDTNSRFTFDAGTPLSHLVAVGVRARTGVRAFHFDGDGQFLDAGKNTGEPFDELFQHSITLGTRIGLTEWLELTIAGRGIARHEEGARFSKALEGGGSVSFQGRYRDWMRLRLGVAVGSRFSDSKVQVGPVFRLRVRLHPRVWAETSGRKGRIEFTVNERIRIDLFGGNDGSRYRLKDRRDGSGGVGQGSLRLKRTNVGIGTRLQLTKGLRILLEAGAVLTQTLEILDEDDNSFDERSTREPAFQGRVALKWKF